MILCFLVQQNYVGRHPRRIVLFPQNSRAHSICQPVSWSSHLNSTFTALNLLCGEEVAKCILEVQVECLTTNKQRCREGDRKRQKERESKC